MDRKCQQATGALEISGNYLKCQKCNPLVPMVGKFPRPHSDRIAVSERSDMLNRTVNISPFVIHPTARSPSLLNEPSGLIRESHDSSKYDLFSIT
ncbi:MAG TPA: hypothetical protein VFJ51_14540 [Nitrososphaeraceae archaeon]|nr:hypothetical protein [Nitrososphaeraceae archaeon]